MPPDLSPHYLIALIGPVLELIGMTAGAMLIAYLISLPLGLYIGLRAPATARCRPCSPAFAPSPI